MKPQQARQPFFGTQIPKARPPDTPLDGPLTLRRKTTRGGGGGRVAPQRRRVMLGEGRGVVGIDAGGNSYAGGGGAVERMRGVGDWGGVVALGEKGLDMLAVASRRQQFNI